MTFQEIRIIATGPCIAKQLQDVNTICRRTWYLAAPVLEGKETTDTASFLHLYMDFGEGGQFSATIYDKPDDFNLKIINFPNMCSNIPASPAYGVCISQLFRYARASSNYSDFTKRHLHLRNRLLDQGY
jgi:hypothetical protein